MSIKLSKGQKLNLSKENPNLHNLLVGLGWDVNTSKFDSDYDLDASVFLLGDNDKCQADQDFIFYGNLDHSSGGVCHMGDNLVGGSDGDDEQISIHLDQIPERVSKIVFTVTIYEAETRRQNFGRVSNAYIRVVDSDSDSEILRYDLADDFSIETAVIVGELCRNKNGWKFNAIGEGYQGGLAALCARYGIDAE